MNLSDITHTRLIHQQIAASRFNSARDLVGWMGAMQAQDYAMSKWAVGLRIPGATEQVVEDAITRGDILRTHVMRPTWHFVSADDLGWMLQLTASQIRANMRSRLEELEISEPVWKLSNQILETILRDGQHLTREEIAAEFQKAGIVTIDNRLSHLLVVAELDGIVCSGGTMRGKPTYALLDGRAAQAPKWSREEALAALAKRYFSSHAPATLQDFTWWSGLPVRQARQALKCIQADLVSETIEGLTFWFPPMPVIPETAYNSVYLLPAYDEWVISYADRRATLPLEQHALTISSNGLFKPMIVVDGQVTGIWSRTVKKDRILVETTTFTPMDDITQALIEGAALQFGRFLKKKIEISHRFAS